VLWTKRCESAPAAPPAIDARDIFVPMMNGRVERMNIVAHVVGGSVEFFVIIIF
jgi:hypothetical protein